MAKQKTKHTNKISPQVSDRNGVDYGKLSIGECFLAGGSLYMKESEHSDRDSDQSAVNLATGVFQDGMCGNIVTPVTINIAWKKK